MRRRARCLIPFSGVTKGNIYWVEESAVNKFSEEADHSFDVYTTVDSTEMIESSRKKRWHVLDEDTKTNKIKFVSIRFVNGHSYSIKDFITDLDLQKDDVVVVDAASGLGLGTVVRILDDTSETDRWVVGRVDMDTHNARIKRFDELKKLKAKMERRLKAHDDLTRYESLAKDDPEMQDLLAQFKALSTSV